MQQKQILEMMQDKNGDYQLVPQSDQSNENSLVPCFGSSKKEVVSWIIPAAILGGGLSAIVIAYPYDSPEDRPPIWADICICVSFFTLGLIAVKVADLIFRQTCANYQKQEPLIPTSSQSGMDLQLEQARKARELKLFLMGALLSTLGNGTALSVMLTTNLLKNTLARFITLLTVGFAPFIAVAAYGAYTAKKVDIQFLADQRKKLNSNEPELTDRIKIEEIGSIEMEPIPDEDAGLIDLEAGGSSVNMSAST